MVHKKERIGRASQNFGQLEILASKKPTLADNRANFTSRGGIAVFRDTAIRSCF